MTPSGKERISEICSTVCVAWLSSRLASLLAGRLASWLSSRLAEPSFLPRGILNEQQLASTARCPPSASAGRQWVQFVIYALRSHFPRGANT